MSPAPAFSRLPGRARGKVVACVASIELTTGFARIRPACLPCWRILTGNTLARCLPCWVTVDARLTTGRRGASCPGFLLPGPSGLSGLLSGPVSSRPSRC